MHGMLARILGHSENLRTAQRLLAEPDVMPLLPLLEACE